MTSNRLSALRREYSLSSLNIVDCPSNPIILCKNWVKEAVDKALLEPNAMSLCTVSKKGYPSLRTVLLKDISTEGFVFFTNYTSRKAQDIEEHHHVALLLCWIPLERQIRIEGQAKRCLDEVSDAYFALRPRESQLAAWASIQSQVMEHQKDLQVAYTQQEKKFADQDTIPRPPFWGGYVVVPEVVEFWQGKANRLHDRVLYTKERDQAWSKVCLFP